MDILFLTPQPIYQDRGSPIAVDLVLRVLSEREEQVDVLTYHEGRDNDYPHVNVHRIPNLPFVRNIRAGFSWKKVVCDLFMVLKAFPLVSRHRYHLVHAVEEAGFLALLFKLLFNIPYVYDMDSSLPQQMIEQFPWLAPFSFFFNFLEGLIVRNATVVVPVCDALAETIEKYGPEKVVVLHDVSLLKEVEAPFPEDLKQQLGINGNGLILMYVGNLQEYQGIDLLLDGFARARQQMRTDEAHLVIIGGASSDIEKYLEKSRLLNIEDRVHFLGPRPVEHLAAYLSQADILVSPRIKGNNTPMKIYSYLHSGKPVLATNLPTHTQVLNNQAAMLVEPVPEAFSEGIVYLVEEGDLRLGFAEAGRKLIENKYSYSVFQRKLNQLLDWLAVEIDGDPNAIAKAR